MQGFWHLRGRCRGGDAAQADPGYCSAADRVLRRAAKRARTGCDRSCVNSSRAAGGVGFAGGCGGETPM